MGISVVVNRASHSIQYDNYYHFKRALLLFVGMAPCEGGRKVLNSGPFDMQVSYLAPHHVEINSGCLCYSQSQRQADGTFEATPGNYGNVFVVH